MKKSGFLMILGPLVILLAPLLAEGVATLLFGSPHLLETGGSGDYAWSNRTNATLTFSGLGIYILGCIFIFIEMKQPVVNQKSYGLNLLSRITGTIILLLELGYFGFLSLITANWK